MTSRASHARLAIAAVCVAAAGCGVAAAPSAGTIDRPAATPDVLLDGFAIGPARDTRNPGVFHRLEVAARGAWTRAHPGQAVSGFTVHHAGRLADGTIQAGTDEPFTYLMVIEIQGGERRALVLHCSPLTQLSLGDCG